MTKVFRAALTHSDVKVDTQTHRNMSTPLQFYCSLMKRSPNNLQFVDVSAIIDNFSQNWFSFACIIPQNSLRPYLPCTGLTLRKSWRPVCAQRIRIVNTLSSYAGSFFNEQECDPSHHASVTVLSNTDDSEVSVHRPLLFVRCDTRAM